MSAQLTIWFLIGLSFTTYFIVSGVYKKLGIQNLQSALLSANGLRLLNLKHILGIVLFGILFYTMTPELRHLVDTIEIPRLHILLPFLLVFLLSGYISNLSIQRNYEIQKIGITHSSFIDACFYFIVRFAFLLCYEFFFRGVLLYKFLEYSGLFLAILYTTALYLLIHIFDSKKEIFGAIPFGIILCLLTYFTNSVWYAFLVHLALSAVYEISIFYYLTIKNKTIS